jgi:hypothetical protein
MKFLWYTFLIVMAGIGFYYLNDLMPTAQEIGYRIPASERTPTQAIECKYAPADLAKPIIGYGATLNAARAQASQKCFDVRMHAAERKNIETAEYEEIGLINIDECANIRCS